ncbi:hypothetical protein IHE45_07G055700 [Dioscorea alata]|uniref:Uncharacterized protein n=1 Tax=Dioscorea alata TaxID=55571 RepID=A0ACB7VQV6_DIOAL|nr:hypothetical protein IHE45_07G055700 [Dioscorea alata]
MQAFMEIKPRSLLVPLPPLPMDSSLHPLFLHLHRPPLVLHTIALRRSQNHRRKRKPIIISTVKRILSFSTSLRKLCPPFKPLDLLLQHGGTGNGGGGGLRTFGRGSGGGDWFERSVKGPGFVGLVISLVFTAAISLVSENGESKKRNLGLIGVLISGMMGLKRRVWRRRVGVLMLLVFVLIVFLNSSVRFGKDGRSRRVFWRRS